MTENIEIPFNFPQIPDDASDDMRQFLVELRRMITSHFVADGSPKEFVDVMVGSKGRLTPLGGLAILLTNKSGAVSVAGDVIQSHATIADAVIVADASATNVFGAFYESGIADGSSAWIVVAGKADIHMDAGGCSVQDRIITSATAGRGDVSNAPAVAVHFQEIGHAIEAAAANANALCVIHFN